MPSSVRFEGMDELRKAVAHLKGEVADKAVRVGQNAAARVAKLAIEAAAPVGTGERLVKRKSGISYVHEAGTLKKSITISRKTLNQALVENLGESEKREVLVGPSRHAYYGYFLEKGWHPVGRAEDVQMRKNRNVYTERTRRRARGRSETGGHSAHGVVAEGFRPGSKWFSKAINKAMPSIEQAGRRAIELAVKKAER